MLIENNLISIDCVRFVIAVPFLLSPGNFSLFKPIYCFELLDISFRNYFVCYTLKKKYHMLWIPKLYKEPVSHCSWKLEPYRVIVFRCSLPPTCFKAPHWSASLSSKTCWLWIFPCFDPFMLFEFVNNWELMFSTLTSLLLYIHSEIGNHKEKLQWLLFDLHGREVASVKRY